MKNKKNRPNLWRTATIILGIVAFCLVMISTPQENIIEDEEKPNEVTPFQAFLFHKTFSGSKEVTLSDELYLKGLGIEVQRTD